MTDHLLVTCHEISEKLDSTTTGILIVGKVKVSIELMEFDPSHLRRQGFPEQRFSRQPTDNLPVLVRQRIFNVVMARALVCHS